MIILNIYDSTNVSQVYKVINGRNININDLVVNVYNEDFTNLKLPYRINNFIIDSPIQSNIDLDELLLKIKEKNIQLIVKDSSVIDDEFLDACNYYKVSINKRFFDFDRNIDLKNLSENDWAIILEIFEDQHLTANNYVVGKNVSVVDVKSNKILVNKQIVNDFNITHLFVNCTTIIPQQNQSSPFNLNFYTNDIYNDLECYDNLIQNIIDYKFRVFESIKNIEPHQYSDLNRELIYYLYVNNYVRLDDIKELLLVGDEDGNTL